MKKIISLLFTLASFGVAFAQSPESFKYQAIARNAAGEVYASTAISFQITILQSSTTGTNVYTETHAATTNDYGLVSLSIGNGNVLSGDFTTIDWGNDIYFVQVEMDPAGGSNYQLMGTSQLLSVPYALHAKTASSTTELDPIYGASVAASISSVDTANWNNKLDNEVDGSITNELQAISISNDTIYLSDGGFVKLPAGFDGQYSSLTGAPALVSAFTNDAGYLSSEVDGSITNEIQALSLSNDTIYLSDGGFVKLPAAFDGQYSSLTGAPTNVSTFTNDAGYLSSEVDGSITNEIQDLQLSGDDLSITNNASATTIDLSSYSNLWTESAGNISRASGNLGIGANPGNSRILIRDTLTGSDNKGVQALVVGGTTSNTTYNGFLTTLNGTNGTQRAGEFQSSGTNPQVNHGIFSTASNGNENIGIYSNAGVGQGSTNGGLNYGVFSIAENSSFYNIGVAGKSGAQGSFNYGVFGFMDQNSGNPNYGTAGYAYGTGSGKNYGLEGYAAGSTDTNFAVYASTGTTGTNFAGYFLGDVTVTGDLNVTGNIAKGGGTFKIDHPLDPENKYLVHSFVESPEMMNVYNGNTQTDAQGFATVTLPDYFESANKEFRYQLTVMGQFAQAIVKDKINGNQFVIQTSIPNVEVSWQVTGVRKDPYANANRIKSVEEKDATHRGKYLHPEAYGKPKSMGINGSHSGKNMSTKIITPKAEKKEN